ncbi:hypothetical protein OS11_18130 [Dickeya oryzae]
MVAGWAIIATRCLGIVLTISELGWSGFGGWLSSSAKQWDSTLVLLAALLVVCLEIRCGFAVLSGLNWGALVFSDNSVSGHGLYADGVVSGVFATDFSCQRRRCR